MKNGKKIIDVCCGSRMFWFDKNNEDVIFNDLRNENHILCDGRELNINPDTMMDFANLNEIESGSMKLVIFDPPHMDTLGVNSWMAKKYGRLQDGWQDNLKKGFKECFRILDALGVVVETVVAALVLDEQENQQTTRHPHCQPGHVDDRVPLVPLQIAKRNFEIVLEHGPPRVKVDENGVLFF